MLHPHLHCVVTGGGLSPDGRGWIAGRERYLLPVKVLGRLFRGKFLAGLQQAYRESRLDLAGSTAQWAAPAAWGHLRDQLYRRDWVVYAKPPFGDVQQVFRYLGRYTHRVAISNHRLLALRDGRVSFTVKDYKDGARRKVLTLDAVEFLRRFLLHVLPRNFVRIRHYGLYASRHVQGKLATARRLLQPDAPDDADAGQVPTDPVPWWEQMRQQTGIDPMQCPCCGGRLMRRGAQNHELGPPHGSRLPRAPPEAA
jgi:hypothetical protein